MKKFVRYTLGAGLVFGTAFLAVASSHREAPLISEDPVADNTDVYAFVSPDQPNTVTLIANWIPLEEPAGGPNFYKFGDDVLYRINVDNDGDADDDIAYEFRFQTRYPEPEHVPLQHRADHVAERPGLQHPAELHGHEVRPARPHACSARGNSDAAGEHRPAFDAQLRRARGRGGRTRCPAAARCSPASATTRSSWISARCSTCSACGRSIPPTASAASRAGRDGAAAQHAHHRPAMPSADRDHNAVARIATERGHRRLVHDATARRVGDR